MFSEERREKCLEPHPLTISAVSRRLAHEVVPARLDRGSVIAAPPPKSALCPELAEPFYRTDFIPLISLSTAQTQMLTLTSLSAPAVDTPHHSSKRKLDLFQVRCVMPGGGNLVINELDWWERTQLQQ